ncbi:MAG: helix-turn-helix domain-containing protein [Planctomycetes bacterium]|nr:helix-turn-helix domain-containing protein [Planctomycetota bacterium]
MDPRPATRRPPSANHPQRLIPPGSGLLTGHFVKPTGYETQRPHGSDDWLIIDTVAGGGIFAAADGGSFAVRAGDLVLLRPGHPHAYRTDPAPGTWELAWVHVLLPDPWLDLVAWPEPVQGLLHLHLDGEAHAAVTACLDQADAWTRGAQAQRDRLALNAIERALLLLAQANPEEPGGRIEDRLRTAMDRALADLARPLAIADLARAAGLSPSRFAHRFRDQVGDSPGRWFERERMRRAAALLDATARTVADIAAEVGFPDPFYFSQRFRRWAGRSPRAWRQRHRSGG